MLWQIMLLVCGILSLGYYGLICLMLRKWDSTFSRFWLAAGVLFLLGSQVLLRTDLDGILQGILTVAAVVFAVTEAVIVRGMYAGTSKDTQDPYPWVIVLGAQVNGREITDSLSRRLETAREYLEAHQETKVVVSGGQGKGEDITEAAAMAAYLVERGIEKGRIHLEDRSRTTYENLKFTREILGRDVEKPIAIVSNNFHLYRAVQYAKQLGYPKAYPLAADCHPVLFVNYMTREFFAVWKRWLHI